MIPFDEHALVTRRSLIGRASAAAGFALVSCGAQQPGVTGKSEDRPESAGEAEQRTQVEKQAEKAGLGALATFRAENFVCVGNAPEGYCRDALEICESMAKTFIPHLRGRGFKVAMPRDRMMIVVLKDSRSYELFLGERLAEAVGGHYDLDSNRLVIFDFRPDQGDTRAGVERVNTFTLVHETAHLLSFNTGLLAIKRQPAECITEGLATYFEMWRPWARAGVGAVNRPRLTAIRQAAQNDVPWIEIGRLFVEDDVFYAEKTSQLAYGESWLLMNYLLQSRTWNPRLVAYLKALAELPAPQSDADRVKTAEEHLGSMDQMNERMRRQARSLLRS